MRPGQVRYFRWVVKVVILFGVVGITGIGNAGRLVADPPRPCVGRSDHAFVPSGDPGPRTTHAVRLFREGLVDAIAISGAGYGGDAAEVLVARARELEPDVPLVVETQARSTAANVANTCALAGPRVAIVTDPAHAARVYLTVRQLCPAWTVCTSPTDEATTLWMQARETFRLLGYQLTGRASWGIRP